MNQLATEPFASLFAQNTEYCSLINSTLLLCSDQKQRSQSMMLWVKKVSEYSFFPGSALSKFADAWLNSAGNSFKPLAYVDLLQRMQSPSAKQQLDGFYHQLLTQQPEWPTGTSDSTSEKNVQTKNKQSGKLKRLLSKPTIDTGWQHTPTGKGFSVTRMILEEPPFKKSVEGAGNLSRPAVFYMNRTTLKELKTTYSLWERSRSEFSPGPGELESTDTLRTFRTAATSSTFSTALGASFGMQEDNHLDDSNSMQGQHAYIRNQPSNHPSFEHMTDQFFHWLHQQCPNPNTSWLMPESVQGDEKITVPAGRYNTPPHAEQIGLISKGGDVSEEFSWPAPKKSLIREGIDEEAVLIDTELMKQLFKEFLESRTQSELKPPIAQRSLARNG